MDVVQDAETLAVELFVHNFSVFKDLSTKDLMANAVEFVFLHSIVLL
jgi:hypothetical protein